MANTNQIQRHPYHLVDQSPWPLVGAVALFTMATGGVMCFHSYAGGDIVLTLGAILIIYTKTVWWRDVVRESTFEGHHTAKVQQGLRYGMILFILSECMFFFAFFWAYFGAALSPTIEVGAVWPPMSITALEAFEVPLLNTLILLTSGFTCTWAHHAIVAGERKSAITGLALTVVLGLFFTFLQGIEYMDATFTIADGIYGSTFYLATGFHGIHVIVGTIFLIVCLFRLVKNHFTVEHHFGFEAAAWYWHFVDVVWIILYISIYCWGSM